MVERMEMEGGMKMNRLFGVFWMVVVWGLLVGCVDGPTPEPTAVGLLPVNTRPQTATSTVPVATATPTLTPGATNSPVPVGNVATATVEDHFEEFGGVVEDIAVVTVLPPTPRPMYTATPTAIVVTAGPLPTVVATADIWTGIGTPMVAAQAVISPENVGELTLLGRWGKGTVLEAAYSPDGQRLVLATPLGVYFYDALTAEQQAYYPVESELIDMAIAPDWQTVAIATGYPQRVLEVRRVADGSLLWAVTDGELGIAGLGFTADSQFLSGGGVNVGRRTWRVEDGSEVELPGHDGYLTPNGQTLIRISEENDIRLWTFNGGDFVDSGRSLILPRAMESIDIMAVSPDSQLFAVGDGWSRTVFVWRISDGTLLYELDVAALQVVGASDRNRLAAPARVSGPGRDHIGHLAFSSDSRTLGVTTGFYDVTLWQADNGRFLHQIPNAGYGLAFSPDGSRLATWAFTLSQWQMPDGIWLNSLRQHNGGITSIAFVPGSGNLAAGSGDGLIYLRRVSDGALFTSLAGHEWGVNSVAVSADGNLLVSGSDDETIQFWNLAEGTSFSRDASDAWWVRYVAISADGQIAASGAFDDRVRWWRTSDGELINANFGGGYQGDHPMAFSPTESLFATHGTREGVSLWAANGEEALPGIDEFLLNSIVFSSNGQYLAAASIHPDMVMVWRVADRVPLLRLEIAANSGVAISPDNQILAVLNHRTLTLWRMSDGAGLLSIPMQHGYAHSVTFSPDGRLVVVGGYDGTVRLWGVP
jgi:WD40 repeat protein